MSVSLVIIADDLTGALDSIEPFAAAGLTAATAICLDGVAGALASGPQVLAVNTQTRAVSAQAARDGVEAAWRQVAPHAPAVVFKKIDSRMKGHVAAETDALARLSGRDQAIVCPAVPDVGRFVRDGRVVGHGVAEPILVAGALSGLDLPVTIVDSADDAALLAPAARVRAASDHVMAVGARGFARALAQTYAPAAAAVAAELPRGPMLMVIGSRDPVTDLQVERLCAGRPSAELTLLRAPRDVCGRSAQAVADDLAAQAAQVVRETGVRTLLCCGGDTLAAVARALEIDWVTPLGAASPGVPLSRGQGRDGAFILISKSGGFGDPDALVRIAAMGAGA